MSFPSSFGSQVAAIMDVLAKAAVAEITKLMEDGTVVLRLGMCQKDSEIQELKRSLRMMEAELCKAQEAATTRAAEEKKEQAAAESPVPRRDDKEESLCEAGRGAEESRDMKPAVKHEPVEELVIQETTDCAVRANLSYEAAEQVDLMWPPPACSLFDKSPVATQQQQIQVFSPPTEQFAHPRNTKSSYNSSASAAKEVTDDSSSAPIKVEVEMSPMCMGSAASEAVHNEQFPAGRQDSCLQPAPQQAGPSRALPHTQRSMTHALGSNTEDHILSRNNLRAKRLLNVWKANPKLFICSVCNRGFPRMCQLEEHKASHQLIKPFKCLECGKSFTQKTRLKTHQSVHTGERPYSCKICGKMFSRQDNCLRHERFHSGMKPHCCGQCGKSFTVLGNLKIHQEIHLQGR